MRQADRVLARKALAVKREREESARLSAMRRKAQEDHRNARTTRVKTLKQQSGERSAALTLHRRRQLVFSAAVKAVNQKNERGGAMRRVNRHPNPNPNPRRRAQAVAPDLPPAPGQAQHQQQQRHQSAEEFERAERLRAKQGAGTHGVPMRPEDYDAPAGRKGSRVDELTDGVSNRQSSVWGRIFRKQAQETKKIEVERKTKELAAREVQARALDKQVAWTKKVKADERERERVYARQLAERLKREEEAEKAKAKAIEDRNRAEVENFHAIIRERKERRERQQRVAIELELAEVDRAKQALAEEKERAEERKRQKALALIQTKKDNERLREMKREQQLARQAEERELERQYRAMLEKQEADRANALAKTYARQARLVAMGKNTQQILAERLKEDEDRAARFQAERWAAREREDREKEQKRQAATQKQLDSLAQQMQMREAARREEEALAQREHEQAMRRDREAVEQMEREQKGVRERNLAHRAFVERQMREDRQRKRREQNIDMTEMERKFNSQLLEGI